jgi:hypothetical protein
MLEERGVGRQLDRRIGVRLRLLAPGRLELDDAVAVVGEVDHAHEVAITGQWDASCTSLGPSPPSPPVCSRREGFPTA